MYGIDTGFEIWKFDATGQHLVKDVAPESANGALAPLFEFNQSEISNWSVIDDRIFFTVLDRKTGFREIWVTNGTEKGTFQVRHDLESRLVINEDTRFVSYGGGIAFAAATEEVGNEMFQIRIDAAVPGAQHLKIESSISRWSSITTIEWPDAAAQPASGP